MTAAERIARFSRGPSADRAPRADERVVLLDEGPGTTGGEACVRAALLTAARVRVVADGILGDDRFADHPRVVCTELGAFAPRHLGAHAALRARARATLDRIFPRLFGDQSSDVFYAAAVARVLQGAFEIEGLASGIASALPAATVTAPRDTPLLHAVQRHLGRPPAARSTVRDRGALLGWAAVLGAAVIVETVSAYAKERAPRREIRRRRGTGPAPGAWVALVPTRPRFNRHIVGQVVGGLSGAGEPPGTLIFGSFAYEELDEKLRRKARTRWPGLDGAWRPGEPIDQVAAPESLRELGATLVAGTAAMLTSTGRLVIHHALVRDWALEVEARPRALASLVTIDVMRAVRAREASRAATRRSPIAGRPVIVASSASAIAAATEATLRAGGARTVEYLHGSFAELREDSFGSCPRRLVWTAADAAALAPFGVDCIVAGMPRPAPPPSSPAGRRVLLVSNYAHRDLEVGGRFPREVHLRELVRLAPALRAVDPTIEVRLRPHPADDPEVLARAAASVRDLPLSREPSLAADFAWADVVASAPSSVAFEALFVGRPVFVHDRAETEDTPATSFFSAGRRFYHAPNAVPGIVRCLAAQRVGDDCLGPEREALRRLFPPDGVPRTVAEVVKAL